MSKKTHMVTFDQAEIVCILLEELSQSTRPAGMTAAEALAASVILNGSQAQADRFRAVLEHASDRIVEYVVGQLRAMPGFIDAGVREGRLQ